MDQETAIIIARAELAQIPLSAKPKLKAFWILTRAERLREIDRLQDEIAEVGPWHPQVISHLYEL